MRDSRRRGSRGIALGVTMMFLVILVLGGLAISTVAVQHLGMAQSASNSLAGMQVVEAGLAQLKTTIEATPTYAQGTMSVEGTLPATNARWWANFGTTGNIPAKLTSINNLNGATAVTRADGSIVPPFTADVIVSTRVQSAGGTKLVSAGMTMTNRWDAAVASSGQFSAQGGLIVTGASSLQKAYDVLYSSANGDLPGNLVANSTWNPSVSLKNNNTITGIITTPGTVYPSNTPNVEYGTLPIPNITWTFYTPDTTAPTTQVLAAGSTGSLTLSSTSGKTEYYVDGNLDVTGGLDLDNVTLCVKGSLTVGGGLRLNNARIYTNGNMTVTGGIKDTSGQSTCTGSIFVCGDGHDFNVSGAATMSTGNTTGISVYAQGNIYLSGGAFVQGVLYSHSDVRAKGNAQMVGVAIANGNTDTQLVVTGGASFVYCPVYSQTLLTLAGTQMKVRKLSWRLVQ